MKHMNYLVDSDNSFTIYRKVLNCYGGQKLGLFLGHIFTGYGLDNNRGVGVQSIMETG